MKQQAILFFAGFALVALACFAAAVAVLGAESIDEGLNLSVQSDMENVSPELAGVEMRTVLGLIIRALTKHVFGI